MQKDETGMSTHGRGEMYTQVLVRKPDRNRLRYRWENNTEMVAGCCDHSDRNL